MVKFLKPNKAVVFLQGHYAGCKVVIINEGTRDSPYGHYLVTGIKKYPNICICRNSMDMIIAR
ncbi:hypothetical protein PVK06_012672 [Gossypium arboreum]|uniref:Uncharacterized protein n=1 Tax=Gossypium arboreum TaxID=29729 RepID=A0ABR0QD35_GOSAR|nr:hypothetical protein PVK06_012672 [Gossypium arboreum]